MCQQIAILILTLHNNKIKKELNKNIRSMNALIFMKEVNKSTLKGFLKVSYSLNSIGRIYKK